MEFAGACNRVYLFIYNIYVTLLNPQESGSFHLCFEFRIECGRVGLELLGWVA